MSKLHYSNNGDKMKITREGLAKPGQGGISISEIEKTRCDNCGKETEDIYKEHRWLHICAGGHTIQFVLMDGREENGNAKVRMREIEDQADFCSITCLSDFVAKLKSGFWINFMRLYFKVEGL